MHSKPDVHSNGFKALKHFHGPYQSSSHSYKLACCDSGLASLDGLTGVQDNLNWIPLVVAWFM
jgi:hypothetical protein